MVRTYNIYCDESCHLENDKQKVMVLGAIWCPQNKRREIAEGIRRIKIEHGLPSCFEIKWTKVSQGKSQFYLDLIDYFFMEDSLHFRALVVPDKSLLRHRDYAQNHSIWYFKMYFEMLKTIFRPDAKYNIYLDIKDTRSMQKIHRLHDILCSSQYDFDRQIIKKVQAVQSYEIEQIQLADLLIGAVSYANRQLHANQGKVDIVKKVTSLSGYSLTKTTLLMERKVNIFVWQAS
jgi:hypothetical protein